MNERVNEIALGKMKLFPENNNDMINYVKENGEEEDTDEPLTENEIGEKACDILKEKYNYTVSTSGIGIVAEYIRGRAELGDTPEEIAENIADEIGLQFQIRHMKTWDILTYIKLNRNYMVYSGYSREDYKEHFDLDFTDESWEEFTDKLEDNWEHIKYDSVSAMVDCCD